MTPMQLLERALQRWRTRHTEQPVQPESPLPAALPANTWQQVVALDTLRTAWERVRGNAGVAGTDGQSVTQFEAHLSRNLFRLQDDLRSGRYRPAPALRLWAGKASGGQRPLALFAVRDRVAQRAVCDVLTPFYERRFLECSYGFRAGRSVKDAVNAIAHYRGRGLRHVVDGDIAQFFERVDHEILLGLLGRDIYDTRLIQLIRMWLQARVLNEMRPAPISAHMGTPQGAVISPLLSNIYLHPFDEALTQRGLALVRYADDWVILCKNQVTAETALQIAEETLARLRLTLNPRKTKLKTFEQGFSFVGTFFVRNKQYLVK